MCVPLFISTSHLQQNLLAPRFFLQTTQSEPIAKDIQI
jgi:hypothetical protein